MRFHDIIDRRNLEFTTRCLGVALLASLTLAGPLPAEEEEGPRCGDALRALLEKPEREGFTRTDLSEGDQVVVHIQGPRGGEFLLGCTGDQRFKARRLPDEDGELGAWQVAVGFGISEADLPTYEEYDFPGDAEIREDVAVRPFDRAPCRLGPIARPRPGPGGRIRIPRMRPGQRSPDFGGLVSTSPDSSLVEDEDADTEDDSIDEADAYTDTGDDADGDDADIPGTDDSDWDVPEDADTDEELGAYGNPYVE